jgi:bis(5'-nucleosyl)-tetraphosphatase (symmetrical)
MQRSRPPSSPGSPGSRGSLGRRGGRRIFIGDVQGCRGELERLLDALRYDPLADQLEPVGDLVNRGPDSAGVLRLLRRLGAGGVLGNHDLHLLRVAAGRRALSAEDTCGDVLAADDREDLLAWLGAKPLLRAWPDVLLVHAGLHPRWSDPRAALAGVDPLSDDPRVEFATRARCCDPEGRLPSSARPGSTSAPGSPGAAYRPWHEHARPAGLEAHTVVFGHWAAQGLIVRPGLRGLDSGCVWGGKLSAWIAEEDRIVAVAAERAWARLGTRA